MVDDAELLARAEALVTAYAADGRTVATAESCTGGLVAGLLTAVPGSSAVLERGFVTYSNDAKAEAIGVPIDLIRRHGAVSEPVARAMAAGALAASRASVAVAITGIAGPGAGAPRSRWAGAFRSRPAGWRDAPSGAALRRSRARGHPPRRRGRRARSVGGRPRRLIAAREGRPMGTVTTRLCIVGGAPPG